MKADPNRQVVRMAAALLLLIAGPAGAENSVIVESKHVEPGATDVRVGVYLSNDEPLLGVVVPLEIRSIEEGSFIRERFEVVSQGRVILSGLMEFGGLYYYGEPRGPVGYTGQGICPESYAWSEQSGSTSQPGFFESPDAFMWVGIVASGNPLPEGNDQSGEPSILLHFDVTEVTGRFKIDTCCVAPANKFSFVPLAPANIRGLLFPRFQPGMVTVGAMRPNLPPIAVCHDTTIGTGAMPTVQVSAAVIGSRSFDPDGDPIGYWLIPHGAWEPGEHQVTLVVSDGVLNDSCQSQLTVLDNRRPVAQCHDVIIRSDTSGGTRVFASRVNDGSYDPDGDRVSLAVVPDGWLAEGIHDVVLIVSDGELSDTCPATVDVRDNTRPVAVCRDTTIELDSACTVFMEPKLVDGGSYDPDGDNLSLRVIDRRWRGPGEYDVQLVVSDRPLEDTCTAHVRIVQRTPLHIDCPSPMYLFVRYGDAPVVPDYAREVTACAVDGILRKEQDPPAGSFLTPADTTVRITVHDEFGVVGECVVPLPKVVRLRSDGFSPDVNRPLLIVQFDIEPGQCPGALNAKSDTGEVRVAVLGSPSIDVAQFRPESFRQGDIAALHWEYDDVATNASTIDADRCPCHPPEADGHTDLILYFAREAMLSTLGTPNVGLTLPIGFSGLTSHGDVVTGYDCVRYGELARVEHAPTDWQLSPNYPNPFNASTVIRFSVPVACDARVDVYDILGRHVTRLMDKPCDPGRHSVYWSGEDDRGRRAASGVYFYRLQAGEQVMTRKMTLLR